MSKKKSNNKSQQPISPARYIKEAARKVPIDKVLSDYALHDDGLKQFFVIRKKVSGNYILGIYLVDIFCLGLKSTSYRESMTEYELNDFLNDHQKRSGAKLQEIEPNLAFNVIYGAIEYAEDLGFPVKDKDFAVSEYILPDVETLEYIDIEFGKNGKPFYINGPYDDSTKILATLNRNVGVGNYEFIDLRPNVSHKLWNNEPDYTPDVRIGLQFNFDLGEEIDLRTTDFFENYKSDFETDGEHLNFYPSDTSLMNDELQVELIDMVIETLIQYYEKSSYTNLYTHIPADSFRNRKDFLMTKIFIGEQNTLQVSFDKKDTFIAHFPNVIQDKQLQEYLNHQPLFQYFEAFYERINEIQWNENYEITLALNYETPDVWGTDEDIFSLNIMIDYKNS